MNNILDLSERQKALDPTRSFLVQAPAGSGKTELLIQRFLKLLGGVEYPEQILSMTFTRKAAGEMKTRILDALKNGLNDIPPDSAHQRQTWELARLALKRDREHNWRLLDNPNQLKVITIDSFCAGIIKQMPILSLMGGALNISENVDNLYRDTANRLLAKVESNDETGKRVRTILNHLGNSKTDFLNRIILLLKKRDQWMIPFFDNFKITDDKRKSLEEIYSKLIQAILMELHSTIPGDLLSLPSLASFAGSNLIQENPTDPIASLAQIESLPSSCIDDLPLWRAVAVLLLTKTGEIRKSVNKSIGFPPENQEKKRAFTRLLETITKHDIFVQNLKEVQELPDPYLSDKDWEVLKATLLLLPDMADTLRHIFAEQEKTDFTEISLAAREALGNEDNPTDLLLYLDYKYQHILVDEYQDTSYKQYDFLRRLTTGWMPEDGRTMFIVGDPMQSIYRFRDAEVGLFLKTKNEGIGYIQFDFIPLKTNFRSQKRIVDWVNNCFGSIFPKINNQDLGAITYSPSKASKTDEKIPGIVLHAVKDSPNNDEAIKIARLASSLRQNQTDKSIAILVRSRNHLTMIIRELHRNKIQFRAEDIDPLTSRPEIMDLIALMRALASPMDRVAWLSILRAPWCGISLDDLHKLCAAKENTPIWTLLNDKKRIQTLSLTGRIRLDRIISTLGKVLKVLPNSNFRDLLEGCWVHLGGPACCNPENISDIEIFFDEVSNFIQSNQLPHLQAFQENINNIFANSIVEDTNAIQVMTMHKAKGLEFDFVILPGLEKTSRTEEKRLVYWMPHGEDLLVAPIEEKGGTHSKIYNFLTRFDRIKSEFESLRLLYVATTRAKFQLHLFGKFTSDQNSNPNKGSLLNKLWPYIKIHWPVSSNPVDVSNVSDTSNYNHGPCINRLEEIYKLPPTLPTIETGIVPELQHQPETPEFIWVGSGARHLGVVMHIYFQKLAEEGKESWTEDKIKVLIDSLPIALKSQGLPPQMLPEEIKKGEIMLKNILSHDKGRWILGSHKDARCEYPLTQIKNNTYLSRVIDRTFIDEDNIRWVIDYKTGQHMGSDLDLFFENEKLRYHNQLNQYEEILKISGETRKIKKALYYPMHKEFLVL